MLCGAGRRGSGFSGPPPDGQLEQLIEVMLGTSARIGEVLAIRKCDIGVTVSPATVRICGTIVSPKGQPTHRQHHPKTQKSTRTVSVPSFAAEVLRQRLVLISTEEPDHLIFFSRNHTPLTTNNIRRQLRAVLDEAGIMGVTPHSFRRTVATFLDRASGADLAAEMLGHTSPKITREHYIQPDENVNPVTAEIPGVAGAAPGGRAGCRLTTSRLRRSPLRSPIYHFVMKCITIGGCSSASPGPMARHNMQANHGITSDVADEALGDPSRVVIDPDYNSTSGRSVRIIGFSTRAQDIITVIVVEDGDVEYGVNGWVSNAKDRHIYNAGSHDEEEGEANEQDED